MRHRSNPYTESHQTDQARRMRGEMTVPERLLWGLLRGRRCGGLKFRRQAPIGRYIVDYLCEEAKLVVELDGLSHVGRADEDAERTASLRARGLRVLRVTNDDVIHDHVAVAEHVLRVARQGVRGLSVAGPHPGPLPGGEGVRSC